jgi:hypothetical protein
VSDIYGVTTLAAEIADVVFTAPPAFLAAGGKLHFSGSSGSDTLRLEKSSTDLLAILGAQTWTFALADVNEITVRGWGGNDVLEVADVTKPIDFIGGGGTATLNVLSGTCAIADNLGDDGTLVTVNALAASTAVEFQSTQRLAALNLGDDAIARLMIPGGAIVTSALGMTVLSTLELNTGALVVHGGNLGTATPGGGTAYSGLSGLVASAYDGGAWTGKGITSAAAASANGLTTLGLALAQDVLGLASGETGLWHGQTVTFDSVLVAYTYAGDANLDGTINGDDYAVIDFNSPNPSASGYWNGDFNHDGVIDGDDYALIDFNGGTQGTPLF